ncbi:hypothetical protein [Bacillus thuringiensis]|nr:hypothetical protein [Bacillus thuringiensis]
MYIWCWLGMHNWCFLVDVDKERNVTTKTRLCMECGKKEVVWVK